MKKSIVFLIACIFVSCYSYAQENKPKNTINAMMVRIAEIEIHPQFVKEYSAILKEEAAASVNLEAGVLSIFPMFLKDDSTQVRILEIYAGKEAYQAHLKTPHFLKYKTGTANMVKSLKLVDMDAIDPETLPAIFRKKN